MPSTWLTVNEDSSVEDGESIKIGYGPSGTCWQVVVDPEESGFIDRGMSTVRPVRDGLVGGWFAETSQSQAITSRHCCCVNVDTSELFAASSSAVSTSPAIRDVSDIRFRLAGYPAIL